MTSQQLNSNKISSLISSLQASESKENPYIYSTPAIYPYFSLQYQTLDASSGTANKNGTLNFQLPKQGFIRQILLAFSLATKTGTTIDAGAILNLIDRVQLLSGSRVLSELTNVDLYAQYTNLSLTKFRPISENALKAVTLASAGTSDTAPVLANFCLPICFGYMKDLNLLLNSSFLEPLQIRVLFQNYSDELTVAGGTTDCKLVTQANHPVRGVSGGDHTHPNLIVNYAQFDDADTSQILSENFDRPELNQLVYRFEDVPPDDHSVVAAGAPGTDIVRNIEVKLSDVVNNLYVMVRRMSAGDGTGDANKGNTNPVGIPIKEIEIFSGGNSILKLNRQAYSYTHLCEDGWAENVMPFPATSIANIGAKFVAELAPVKIQFGYKYQYGNAWTGGLSLREISNFIVRVTYNAPNAAINNVFRTDIMLETSAITSISSASGIAQVALSN